MMLRFLWWCAAIWHNPQVILWQDLRVCMCERAAARVFFARHALAFPITFGIFAKDKIVRKNSRCFGMCKAGAKRHILHDLQAELLRLG